MPRCNHDASCTTMDTDFLSKMFMSTCSIHFSVIYIRASDSYSCFISPLRGKIIKGDPTSMSPSREYRIKVRAARRGHYFERDASPEHWLGVRLFDGCFMCIGWTCSNRVIWPPRGKKMKCDPTSKNFYIAMKIFRPKNRCSPFDVFFILTQLARLPIIVSSMVTFCKRWKMNHNTDVFRLSDKWSHRNVNTFPETYFVTNGFLSPIENGFLQVKSEMTKAIFD